MKRKMAALLLLVLLLSALGGCKNGKGDGFSADNEILTYQPIDETRTQLVVSRTGNISVEGLCREFEARNPDIQVIYIDITGGNSQCKPLIEWINNGDTPDVVISAANFFSEELTLNHFENLSLKSYVQNYEAAALKRTAIDDDVYWLPGPSNISAMMYNKTLFSRYGWEVPNTFDEFVALCDKIREDTGGAVEPWNPNAKYDNELATALQAMTYAELFGGADNRSWYNDFISENATFAGHMEPYMEVIKTLASHGILRAEHFTYSATTRGNEFAEGKIAMINVNIYDADNESNDFGYMPFPTTKGDIGYIADSYSCYVGVPIRERTKEQADAVERFLEFFSSAEGQQIYIGKSMKISNVKNVPLNQSADLAELMPAVSSGNMFAVLTFASPVGKQCNVSLYNVTSDIAINGKTIEACIADADKNPYSEASASTPQKVLAAASEDFTILDVSFLIADAYRDAANADIGLIAHLIPYRGNLMRLYAGDITGEMVTVLKPRSFANGSKLQKLSMTGSQLIAALNAPYGGSDTPENCIYAYSGLSCTVAPWNALANKYKSLALADGSAIEPNKFYTVAAWAGSLPESCITEVLEEYEGTWEEMMSAYLAAAGTIAPANDGRIKLIWK